MSIRARIATLILIALLAVFAFAFRDPDARSQPADAERVSVLLLTGQNNHDWERTSRMICAILQAPGLFDVEVWLGPGAETPPDQVAAPNFNDFDVVVWDYNPRAGGSDAFEDNYQWPAALREAWVSYIRDGGRAFLIHASNNPFPGWTEFEDMVGLLWRGPDAGCAIHFTDEDVAVTTPAGEGAGAGHGSKHDYHIRHLAPGHPVLDGLPEVWLHPFDELYHRQRGPCPADIHVLAAAWDDPGHGGTNRHEPMLWQIPYGKGIVMTWLPGHLWRGQDDIRAYECAGFQTILTRAVEWLATGEITQPVPNDFPTADRTSLRPSHVTPNDQ